MTYVDRLLAPAPKALVSSASARQAPSSESGRAELGPLLSVLLLMIDGSRSMVVNVTSAQAGAGTSTIARKLAAAAAATEWCRVALLDAGLEGGGDFGLVDAIERSESPVLRPCRVGAFEIDAGPLSTLGRPLSRIDSVRRLYGTLRDRYSLVVVDCPAVLAGQQTLTIAAAADETVLVVEAEQTALADVGRARSALERRGAGVLGMVINKSRRRVPKLLDGLT